MRSVAQIEPQAGRPPAPAGGGRPGRAAAAASLPLDQPLAAGAVIVVLTYFPIIFVVSNSLKSGQSIFSSGVFSLFTQFDYQNYGTAWSGVSPAAAQHDHRRGGVHRHRRHRRGGRRVRVLPAAVPRQGTAVPGLPGAAAHPVDADPDPAVPHHPEAALLQHLVGADPAVRGQRPAAARADLPRLLRPDPARTAGKRPRGRLHRAPGAARGSSSR